MLLQLLTLVAAILSLAMGYNARNDEICDKRHAVRREWEAQRDALATVRRFNTTLSTKGYVWFWPLPNVCNYSNSSFG